MKKLPEGLCIIATGPLTSDDLAESIRGLCGDALYFYDSISPTVYADSLDYAKIFRASRYEEGEGDYLNIPLNREEYDSFVEQVARAEKVPLHRFEAAQYFEGCLPIEVMVRRGPRTLAFGPMKPVGLYEPPRNGGSAPRRDAPARLADPDRGGRVPSACGKGPGRGPLRLLARHHRANRGQ